MLGLDLSVILLVGLAVVAGSMVQGSAGFGVSLVSVPVLLLLDPSLMPGSMLVVGMLLPGLALLREKRYVDWRIAKHLILGRLVGTAGGVWVVSVLPVRTLTIALGLFILVGVALSLKNLVVPMTTGSLFASGALTGITGTAASISGPVVGLVMQKLPGTTMRATMSAFFSVGTVFSLVGLAIGGQLTPRQVLMGTLMLPFLVLGYALSGPLRRYLDRGWTRTAVLTISTVSALVVLVRAVLT